jgi:DNA-binding IclR family transcriptional regulator
MARYPTRTPLQSSAETGGVAAVDRALMLLSAFSESDRVLSLHQISERTQIVKSTALRLLASLQHFGMVQKLPDGGYALGPTISRLHGIYTASFGLDTVVPPALRALVEKTRESASFHVRQGDRRVTLFRVNSPQPLSDQSRAGDSFPLNRGSGGHVIRAFSGARGALYDGIRRDKVVALVGDRVPELAGVSAPVFEAGGHLVGALTLTMPKERYVESHVAVVREAAAALSEQLGGDFEAI